MPPKRSHARKASTASASSQPSTNHVAAKTSPSPSSPTPPASARGFPAISGASKASSMLPPPPPPPLSSRNVSQRMTLMGGRKRLTEPIKLALLPVIAMAASAALYTGAHKIVQMDELRIVTKEPELWRQAVPVVTRIGGLYAQWLLGFDAINTFAVTLHVRLPYYFLLYLFYNISLQTVATSALIDAASCAIAFFALERRRPQDYGRRASAKSTEANAIYNLTNVVILTGLATAIFGVALFVLSATKLPEWVILSFESVVTVERPHEFHLGQFLALALPLGWSLREFVFGPATAVDSRGHKRQLTASISNRAVVLSLLTYAETFLRTLTSVQGSSVNGAGLWATVWALLIWLVGAALVSVGEAAEPEEFDLDSDDSVELNDTEDARAVLEARDSAIVPTKTTRGRRGGSVKVST